MPKLFPKITRLLLGLFLSGWMIFLAWPRLIPLPLLLSPQPLKIMYVVPALPAVRQLPPALPAIIAAPVEAAEFSAVKSARFPPSLRQTPTPLDEEMTLQLPATPDAVAELNITEPLTVSVALPARRLTPPTIMLHESTPNFDMVQFLSDLIALLQQNGFSATTYEQLRSTPDISALQQGRLVIITIDDVYLQGEIDPSIQEMIVLLREANYPAVLGVVTAGLLPNPATAETLRELSSIGWEIAAHTDTHKNLLYLESTDPVEVRREIRICADKIAAVVGKRPATLILPEGQMVINARLLYKEQITWAIGISGGQVFDPTDRVIYVGREGPAGDAERTFVLLMRRFLP